MSELLTGLLYVVGVGGMFLLLIGPHEAGHFAFAKLFKVRVIEFSIGAGPKLWSFARNGTLYALRALPILGYVRMGGMEAGDFEGPSGFHSKPAWQRIVILAGGPAANFLVAILLIGGFGLTQVNTDPGKVFRVLAGSPVAAAGMQQGDSIRAVNGKPFTSPGLIQSEEKAAPGAPLTLTGVHSDGRPFTYVVTPICDAQGSCRIGVSVAMKLISPIGIANIAAQSVSQGPPTYIFIVALLSVALGFTNLLPLLALDGGRIVVVIIEWLRRRPFDRTMELNFQRWGLVALLALAAVISFLDIQRIMTGQFPGVR